MGKLLVKGLKIDPWKNTETREKSTSLKNREWNRNDLIWADFGPLRTAAKHRQNKSGRNSTVRVHVCGYQYTSCITSVL